MAAKNEKKTPAKAPAKAAPAKAAPKKTAAGKPADKAGNALREPGVIYSEIAPKLLELQVEGAKLVNGNNASAGRRARKLTLELTPLFKEFRASSVAYTKKNLE